MSNLQIFNFNSCNVRVHTIENDPWFVAKDVTDILGIANGRDAVARLDNDEKNTVVISDGNRGNPNVTIINESGLYSLVLTSNKPEAKKFKKWVTSEVLPSIRKNGAYATPETIEKMISDPDFTIKLLTNLKTEQAKRKEAEQLNEINKPKVIFADAVTASKTTILIGDLAKILKQNGVDTGAGRLFEWLRNEGYLIRRNGADYNSPTQKSMELGLFEIKETAISHSDGHVTVSKTPKVTGKGQTYFLNKFLGVSSFNPIESGLNFLKEKR